MPLKPVLACASLMLALLPSASINAGEPARVERGNLVTEGIPEIPAELVARSSRYQQSRGATLEGWLADGSLLITTRFGETAQVHQVAGPGMARNQLTFFTEPVREARPEPGGGGFLFARDNGGNEFYQLYRHDLASGDNRLLSDGTSRNTHALFADAGTRYAYATTRRNGRDSDVHLADSRKPGASTPLVEAEGSWYPLSWSPDGRQLLVGRFVSISESELYLVDIASGERRRFHPTATPVSFSNAAFARDGRGIYFVADEGSDVLQLRYERLDGSGARVLSAGLPWDVDGLALSDDGRWLAYTANVDGASQLRLLDLKFRESAPVPAIPVGLISHLAFDPASRRLGFVLDSPRSASDVFAFVPGAAKPALSRWTRSETGGLKADRFTEPSLIRYPSFDGLSIPAFLYAPAGPGPHPVLISIHGGPEGQSQPAYNAMLEFYVRELGLAVLLPNVRGSSGYGKAYLALDNGRRREDSVRDIGALLDWIATQPTLDAKRVVVMGGSYGGYMSLATLSHYSDRLAGGIDVVGISNFVSFLTNTQDYRRDLRRVEYGDERDPEMRAFLEAISPQTHAAKIGKPLLIVQGLNDPRVPASESEQMVASIRRNGGEVWYLLAKDEGHGFRKKANRDYYGNAVVLFLQQLIGKPAD